MTGIRAVLIACIVGLCGVAQAADAPPAIPAGARIGIIDMVTNDVTHYHVGKSEKTSFLRTYRSHWVAQDIFDDPLITILIAAGFQPVTVQASPALVKERDSWLIKNPTSDRLARGALKEFSRILTEQDLGALIVVAPGANSEPAFDARQRMTRLPSDTRGFGFSTSDDPDGVTKPLVFDFTQMLLLARTPDGAQLSLRDWGGVRLYDWPGFDPGPNIKALTDVQIGQLQPVFADVVKRRIDSRLMPRLKP
jgi:hypothetical protein